MTALDDRQLPRYGKWSTFSSLVLSMEMFRGRTRVLLFSGSWWRIWVLFILIARPSCWYAFVKAVSVNYMSSSERVTTTLLSAYWNSMMDTVAVQPLARNWLILKSWLVLYRILTPQTNGCVGSCAVCFCCHWHSIALLFSCLHHSTPYSRQKCFIFKWHKGCIMKKCRLHGGFSVKTQS